MRNKSFVLSALVASVVGSVFLPHHAAANGRCSGVPMRVNQRTDDVKADVLRHIITIEQQIVQQARTEAQFVLSALKVLNGANSGAASQIAVMTKQASEASASAWSAHRTNMLTLDATTRYKSIGYNACGSISAAKTFAQANKQTTQKAFAALSNEKDTDPSVWYKKASSLNASAADVLAGDVEKTKSYIAMVQGPNSAPQSINSEADAALQLFEYRKTALRSLSAFVLTNTASFKETDAKLDAFLASWVGKDGGLKWAQAMAASHERGVLLDQVRVEAANIAAKAYGLKKTYNSELATAGYALARTNNIIGESTPSPQAALDGSAVPAGAAP